MVRNVSVSQAPPPFFKPSYQERMDDNNNNKISPTVLLIIIILAVIFFISGLLHLLVRFLVKPSQRDPDDLDNNVTALQGQLQQLFHLHDAGVDQSFIDNLPVFLYKSIIGLKNPFDCAVCLCEFEEEDKLRLLPKCSHAFHLECIDTWLLSHSTCPLCRGSLLPDISANCSPLVLVLESGSESSGRVADRDAPISAGEDEFGSSSPTDVVSQKHYQEPVVGFAKQDAIISEQPKVVPVKLGKFRNVDLVGAESSSTGSIASNVDGRRCYSMGSFEYVLDTTSLLQVSIVAPPLVRKQQGIKNRKPNLPLTPTGHRYARSECHSSTCRYGFNGFETSIREGNNGFGGSASIEKSRTESFSISKIWMRSKKKEKSVVGGSSSSRRAFSFRLPVTLGRGGDDLKGKQLSSRMSVSEMEIAEWDDDTQGNMMCSYSRSEIGVEEEHGGVHFNSSSIESHSKTPSFARRTLNWLVGRQNKIVHSSPTTAPV